MMDMGTLAGTIFLGLAPISELRGAIPFAYLRGYPLWQAVMLGAGANLLVSPLVYLFLTHFHRFLYGKWIFYTKVFDHTVARARAKLGPKVETYGMWGIMLFVGVPLPITGAWTGTLGAWVLGLDRRHSMLAASAGVIMSATIVSLILLLGEGMGSIFVKII
jgi:uncharacterized membrane protein